MDPLTRPSDKDQEPSSPSRSASTAIVDSILDRLRSGSSDRRIEAAREVRRLTKTSSRNRRRLADAIEPVVSLLRSGSAEDAEAALPALLNLAVKDESNKIKIIEAGALDPLISFLQSPNSNLQENATATLLTLSASSTNRPVIASTAAIPRLVEILRDGGTPQAKADAVAALSNLSTLPNAPRDILRSRPVPYLLDLLKTSKKSSRTAEKCTSLLEPLLAFEEARTALTAEPGGVLSVVEAVEDGSPRTREHAVGVLLALCRSDRCRYRGAILNEGVIPGLLELTVQGTEKARAGARELLELLRDSGRRRSEEQEEEGEAFEHVVTDIVWRMDGEDRSGKAKRMLEEMVKVSMERSLRGLERRAALMHAPAAES